MADTTRSNASGPRKAGKLGSLFMLLLGFAPLAKASNDPRFHAIPTMMVILLIASGFGFGISLAFLTNLFGTRNR
jgi:hypothetical protein